MFKLSRKKIYLCLIGSAILAFGLYNIHAQSDVTEGGILGMTLLLDYWLHLSPAMTGLIMNALCYLLGGKMLGREFIGLSVVAGGAFSLFYAIFEKFPPLWPDLVSHPLFSAVAGALFVGVGVGLCVKAGGAPGGDDALAMVISKVAKLNIKSVYMLSDLIVLLLSLSYIDFRKIGYSLLTVLISGQIIGLIQEPLPKITPKSS